MGSRDCCGGLSQCNPERRVPMAQQCIRSTQRQHRGMFPFAAEEVELVETRSLR